MATTRRKQNDSTPKRAADAVASGAVKRDVEQGASGTPNYAGFIVGEDYNAKLDGINGLSVYDEMRRSDAQVNASLDVLKLPLLSATWSVQPPTDATPQEQEVADFCQSAIFDDGAMAEPWDFVMQHILLMLPFGCSPLEKVYTLGDDKRIRLHRLAPRLPRTIQRLLVDETGMLTGLVQYAAKGDTGLMQQLTIDAPYLAHFVHNREGDNYLGRSVLRSAYLHWFMKSQAYRIGLIRLNRYGVGIPHAQIDPAVIPTSSTDEITRIDNMLKGMVAHEKAWIRTLKGIDIKILIPEGGKGGDDSIEKFIEHHNLMIARNVLANFLGESGDGLNSGRTRSLLDFFISAIYAVASNITGTLNRSVIRPLCDMNFPMQGKRYPSMDVADVADTDLKGLTENLSKLVPAGFITPDDDSEDLLRKLLGLPAMKEEAKGRVRVPAKPAADPEPPTPEAEPEPPAPTKKKDPKTLSLRQTTAGKTVMLGGRAYARTPTAFETEVFSLSEVPDTLDLETRALAGVLANVRRQQLQTLATQIAKKDARQSTKPFSDIRPDEFSVPLKKDVENELYATAMRVADFGARQVRLEAHRQGAAVSLSGSVADVVFSGASLSALSMDTRDRRYSRRGTFSLCGLIFALDGDPSAAASTTTMKAAVRTSAKVTAERETDAWFNRILETGVRLRRTGTTGEELTRGIIDTLSPEIEVGTLRTAKGEVNEGFALGRAAEARSLAANIEYAEYSCLLDANSCAACADVDGETFLVGSDGYYEHMPPYVECEGNRGSPDACRCVYLYHFKS